MSTPPSQGNPFAQGQNPYAQSPAGAPQPGQPGVPPQQPYGMPGQGAPVPPPAPAKRFSKKLLRIAGFIVIAIIIAVLKWQFGKTDAETTSVGACLHNKGSMTQADLETVDCTSSNAEYKVIEKFDDTSDTDKCNTVKETEVAYYQTGEGHDVVLCLKAVK
ncbi:hypothetical protein ABZZ79_14415 [Streptomyces sp. NPDC006458]|uniref:LppU/SCO3897 family protein n=1 Tax=Streptomyces sp. NPDC006458 TaxID=3154302 RepID=UPI0033A79FA9